MSFNWTDYLDFASRLYEAPEAPELPELEEASFRSAASRAYYATFHCALDLACREGFRPTHSGTDHLEVRKHFRSRGREEELHGEVARELKLLWDRRKEADYRDRFDDPPSSQAYWAVNLATSIIENLDSILAASRSSEP